MHNTTHTDLISTGLRGSRNGAPVTMSSREIAELTGSSHDNVLKTIRGLVKKGVVSGNETPYVHPQNGQTYKQFELDYRNTMIVVSGYSVELRAKIIDRWMELEEADKRQALDFSNPAVVLGVIGHLQEKVLEQQGRLKKLDRLEGAQGSMCISDAAKTLGVQRKWLFDFMSSRRWIFKRSGNKNWLAYDDKRKSLLLEHDDHLYMDDLGQERVSTRVLVTAKGLVKLAELIEKPLH